MIIWPKNLREAFFNVYFELNDRKNILECEKYCLCTNKYNSYVYRADKNPTEGPKPYPNTIQIKFRYGSTIGYWKKVDSQYPIQLI